nr:MAG TPA: hypothetical protein [Caudoviricetes sp.]
MTRLTKLYVKETKLIEQILLTFYHLKSKVNSLLKNL